MRLKRKQELRRENLSSFSLLKNRFGFPICFKSKARIVALFFTCFDFTPFCGTFSFGLQKSLSLNIGEILEKLIYMCYNNR